MHLQKRLSRKIGTKEYVKWVVTIPPKSVKELGWKSGQNLQVSVVDDKLVLKIKKELKKEQVQN